MHRCDNLTFYPWNEDMKASFIGADAGKYRNVNVAWQTGLVVDEESRANNQMSSLGNNEYRRACDYLLFPMVREFAPDVIIVSCGFDAGIHDHLGWSKVSPLMYFYMTAELLKICNKLVAIQEGGYNLDYLGQHSSGVMNALLHYGEEFEPEPTPADKDAGVSCLEDIDGGQAEDWAVANIEETIAAHKPGWQCLN